MAFTFRRFIRNRLLSLAASLSVSVTTLALAQDQVRDRTTSVALAGSDEQRFMIENELAVSRMSLGMMVDPSGDIDRDFVAMMVPHHQGAIDIAVAELKYGHNEELRRLARDIVTTQGREIATMRHAVGIDRGAAAPQPSDAVAR